MRAHIKKRAIRSAAAVIHSQDLGQVFGDDLVDAAKEEEVQDLSDLKDLIAEHIKQLTTRCL